jgi:hypothetical protein
MRGPKIPVALFPEHFEHTAHGLGGKPHLAGESAFAEGPDKTDFTRHVLKNGRKP